MATNVQAILGDQGGGDLAALLQLLAMTSGKKGTTTTTETTGADVSPEVLQAIVKRGMEENMPSLQGAAGQKGAGLYNSTTNSLLQNDLMARLAAEAAKLSTKQTKTSTIANETPAQISGKTLGTGAGAAILAKQLGLFDKDSMLNSLMKQGQNALLGGVVGLGKKAVGDLISGGYGSGDGVGATAVNLPQVFEQHPIFTGDGLPVAGMGFNDPAATVLDGGLPEITIPFTGTDVADAGLGGFTAATGGGMAGLDDLSWLTSNGLSDLGVPSDLTALGDMFDFDPTNLSGAGLDAINSWMDANLGGVLGTGVDAAADAAGALADASGTSILDQFWW